MTTSPNHRLDLASESLKAARDELLEAIQEAGRQQDRTLLRQLTDLAAGTIKLREDIEALRRSDLNESERAVPEVSETSYLPRRIGTMQPDGKETDVSAVRETSHLPRRKREGYPKFSIRGDTLVKAGLKRDGHNVYEHAVPRGEFAQILDRLAEMTGRYQDEEVFGIDEIQKGLDCPVYMTYATASLLLAEGLLRKVRKGAYLFASPAHFAQDSNKLWDKVRNRSSP